MTETESVQLDEIFSTDTSFADLGLGGDLLKAIEKMGFVHPTAAQAEIIPAALAGGDVLGQAKTGTGKTAAFGLPILQMVEDDDPFAALILTPTRELAIQVRTEIRELCSFSDIGVTAVYGGQRIKMQVDRLAKNPQIIVGTPGRVMDMHDRGYLPYNRLRYVVLDEVDRMLDIGFRDDIRKILGQIKQKHQTLFVSATISAEIEALARRFMNDPQRLEVSSSSLTVSQVQQFHLNVEPWDKNPLLVHLLKHEEPALTLVFCRTKQTVDALARYLERKKFNVQAIHGDMYQGKRNRVMSKLRGGDLKVLIASDLAARGLDVQGISHVINYDLPEDPEIYVHRIGRTARAGRDGVAWSFVTPAQGELLSAIEQLTNVEVPLKSYPSFKPGPVPVAVLDRRQKDEQRAEELRLKHSRKATAPSAEEATDKTKFPGGLVPKGVPNKRMGGRLRLRRR